MTPHLSRERAAIVREVAKYGALGVGTPALSAALGPHAHRNARRAELAGHLTSEQGSVRRWYVTEAGRKAIEPPPAGPELAAAHTRIRELENEVLRLQDVIGMGASAPMPAWGLTAREVRFIEALASVYPKTLTHDHALALVWPDSEPERGILSVTVYGLRAKLAPQKISVSTRWGIGYALKADDYDRLRQIGVISAD